MHTFQIHFGNSPVSTLLYNCTIQIYSYCIFCCWEKKKTSGNRQIFSKLNYNSALLNSPCQQGRSVCFISSYMSPIAVAQSFRKLLHAVSRLSESFYSTECPRACCNNLVLSCGDLQLGSLTSSCSETGYLSVGQAWHLVLAQYYNVQGIMHIMLSLPLPL